LQKKKRLNIHYLSVNFKKLSEKQQLSPKKEMINIKTEIKKIINTYKREKSRKQKFHSLKRFAKLIKL
jgi:hypothetical protein